MPEQQTSKGSEYNQISFLGGMNLLLNDTRLQPNQYRILFDGTNREDRLDLIKSSKKDSFAPHGLKQGMTLFGEYQILFVAGFAYYKHYTQSKWIKIPGFIMSASAPRYWFKAIPIGQTNYVRIASTSTAIGSTKIADSYANVARNNVAGANNGNLSGLLVQDNLNQPRFIYFDSDGKLVCRVTQGYSDWSITFTDANNTVVIADGDKREYVPIGNCMEFVDGILYIVSPDGETILRSVEGRPLDFVVNVTNLLAESYPYTQYPGGDAYTTAYSVGVGGITCLRVMADGSLFVAASNANFSVSKNMSNIAPKIFGEWTFIRKFLFNANCLSDRAILDSVGDTKFVDITGVRSFNAIQQSQGNEGRNSIFTSIIQPAFNGLEQTAETVAAILYDDYELYAVNTIFGPSIAVYDTVNSCWSSFHVQQCEGKAIKQFAKIELAFQALFAITEDDEVYQLYVGPGFDEAAVRTNGVCSNILYSNQNIKMANPRMEVKLAKTRVILDSVTEDCSITFTPYVNNRISGGGSQTKNITFTESVNPSTDTYKLPDVDTKLENLLFSTPDCEQGWKVYGVFSWTNGSITQFSMELQDLTPQNPLNSQ